MIRSQDTLPYASGPAGRVAKPWLGQEQVMVTAGWSGDGAGGEMEGREPEREERDERDWNRTEWDARGGEMEEERESREE